MSKEKILTPDFNDFINAVSKANLLDLELGQAKSNSSNVVQLTDKDIKAALITFNRLLMNEVDKNPEAIRVAIAPFLFKDDGQTITIDSNIPGSELTGFGGFGNATIREYGFLEGRKMAYKILKENDFRYDKYSRNPLLTNRQMMPFIEKKHDLDEIYSTGIDVSTSIIRNRQAASLYNVIITRVRKLISQENPWCKRNGISLLTYIFGTRPLERGVYSAVNRDNTEFVQCLIDFSSVNSSKKVNVFDSSGRKWPLKLINNRYLLLRIEHDKAPIVKKVSTDKMPIKYTLEKIEFKLSGRLIIIRAVDIASKIADIVRLPAARLVFDEASEQNLRVVPHVEDLATKMNNRVQPPQAIRENA